MEDLLEWIISILFWPYFWWHGHNQNSTLGTSPDEDETEQFWLKFAVIGTVIVGIIFAFYYFRHQGTIPSAT